MPFRSIVASPEDVTVMTAALDDAWAEIQMRGATNPLTAAAERERLGYIIAGLWEQEERNDLARKAIERYFATGP